MSYAEEQLNHAIEMNFKCHNKKCDRCVDNKCTATNVYKVCSNYKSEPINYEEEYYKVNKENEEMKRLNFGLSDKLETIDDEYQEEIKELKTKIENRQLAIKKLHEQISNTDKYVASCEEYVKSEKENNEKLEKEVEILKDTIKTLANLL